jgi:outer membrane protein assembly factor BamB
MPIGSGYSAVSVASGHLILCHRVKDTLRIESLDPLTGKENWRFAYPTDYEDRYGYNGGPRCAPLIEKAPLTEKNAAAARVYALDPKGALYALELSSGKKLWMRDLEGELRLEANFFGVGAAPILEGKLLIVNLGGTDMGTGFTLALDKADGRLVWKTPTDGGAYAAVKAATIEGERQLFVFHRGGLSCLDPAGGKERWKFPWRSRVYESVNAATPLVVGDVLFFSATYGTGGVALRVKKDSYEVLWKDDLNSREKRIETHWSTAVCVEGYVYGFSGRHEPGSALHCVELKTGEVKWKWPSYLGRGSMIHADGHFIALGERGDLALLKLTPTGHEEVRRVPGVLEYPAWTPPTLANGLLYLRDEEKLVCFDLRPR